jgi:hypothetical protein
MEAVTVSPEKMKSFATVATVIWTVVLIYYLAGFWIRRYGKGNLNAGAQAKWEKAVHALNKGVKLHLFLFIYMAIFTLVAFFLQQYQDAVTLSWSLSCVLIPTYFLLLATIRWQQIKIEKAKSREDL